MGDGVERGRVNVAGRRCRRASNETGGAPLPGKAPLVCSAGCLGRAGVLNFFSAATFGALSFRKRMTGFAPGIGNLPGGARTNGARVLLRSKRMSGAQAPPKGRNYETESRNESVGLSEHEHAATIGAAAPGCRNRPDPGKGTNFALVAHGREPVYCCAGLGWCRLYGAVQMPLVVAKVCRRMPCGLRPPLF